MQRRAAIWGLSLCLATAACGKNEECEKARLAAATSWEDVKKQAGKFKFQGAIGYENLSTDDKAAHHKLWQEVEAQAGLIFDSFAFQKITWTSAENGRKKLEAAWKDYGDKDKYASFGGQLQGALQKYDAAEAACR